MSCKFRDDEDTEDVFNIDLLLRENADLRAELVARNIDHTSMMNERDELEGEAQ